MTVRVQLVVPPPGVGAQDLYVVVESEHGSIAMSQEDAARAAYEILRSVTLESIARSARAMSGVVP